MPEVGTKTKRRGSGARGEGTGSKPNRFQLARFAFRLVLADVIWDHATARRCKYHTLISFRSAGPCFQGSGCRVCFVTQPASLMAACSLQVSQHRSGGGNGCAWSDMPNVPGVVGNGKRGWARREAAGWRGCLPLTCFRWTQHGEEFVQHLAQPLSASAQRHHASVVGTLSVSSSAILRQTSTRGKHRWLYLSGDQTWGGGN